MKIYEGKSITFHARPSEEQILRFVFTGRRVNPTCARECKWAKGENVSQMIWSAMLSEHRQHRHNNSDDSHIIYSVCSGRSCRTFLMGDRSSSAQETLSPLPVILCVSWHRKWAPWATIGIRSVWEFNVDVSVWIICTSGMWFIYLYRYIDSINHTTRWFLNVLLWGNWVAVKVTDILVLFAPQKT